MSCLQVVSKEDLHTAIGSSPPQTTSDNGLVPEDKEGDAGIVIATEEGFESPKLERWAIPFFKISKF